jgi:hypothetical protein
MQNNNQNQAQEQILANNVMTEFMNQLLGGLMNGNPLISNVVKDPNFINKLYDQNMNENETIKLVDDLIKNVSQISMPQKETPEKPKTESVAPNAPSKPEQVTGETIRSELQVARTVQEVPVARKLNFDVDSGLSLNALKDAVFSIVLLTMEKDNIDWSGKRGSGYLPNGPGYNIIDASKRYYTGNRVEKIDNYVRKNLIKDEESFGSFLNKLYGQLIEE